MRLSDFKGEKALDLMADMMEPVTEILNDEKTKALKGQPYMKVAQHILKNHKKNTLRIYELLYEDKAENATVVDLLKMLVDIMSDPDLQSLFSSQGQNTDETVSGSVMENTKENDK